MNKKFDNIVIIVDKAVLQTTLTKYGKQGYQLVNTILAKDKYGKYDVNVIYCFFTKEIT